MKRLYILSTVMLLSFAAVSQSNITVNGNVAHNGGALLAVHLQVTDSLNTDTALTFTDAAGNYSYTFMGFPGTWAGVSVHIATCSTGGTGVGYGYWSISGAVTVNLDYCYTTPPANPCQAEFIKRQSYDSLAMAPIPGQIDIIDVSIWFFNPPVTYLWDFGDGTTSTLQSPTHTYSGSGPYVLCLTETDTACTDTHCDTLSVDSSGIIMKGAPGFTINVGGYQGSAPTAVRELTAGSEFSVFPNPAKDLIQVQLNASENQDVQVKLLDINGKVYRHFDAQLESGKTMSLNVSDLNPGIYVIQLTSGEGVFNERVVIE